MRTQIGMVFLLLGTIGAYAAYSQDQSNSSNFTTQFQAVKYADFASSNGSILDPAKATPNVNEIGTPHLKIERTDKEGYSVVRLPKHGVILNIPFGWASKGGFATMERIDFFPATSAEEVRKAYMNPPLIDLGLKVLDSSELGDFHGVLSEVQKITSQVGEITTDIDEQHHAFLIKIDKINKPNLPQPSSSYMLYMQSPNPNSHVWVKIDIRAPRANFQKYAGLLGLVYNDIQIKWPELEALRRTR